MRVISTTLYAFLVFASLVSTTTAVNLEETNDSCSQFVSDGDLKVGINAYQDLSCAKQGGVGCFAQICRFCKTKDTEQSKFYKKCPRKESSQRFESTNTNVNCPSRVTKGDQSVGISAFYDGACSGGGIGCFGKESCRFCKTRETTQSAPFITCPTNNITPLSSTCDAAIKKSGLVEVSSVTEEKCKVPNPKIVGCVRNTNCRVCRTKKNEKNQFLISCKVLQDLKTKSTTVAKLTAVMDNTSTDETANNPSDNDFIIKAMEKEALKIGSYVGGGIAATFAIVLAAMATKRKINSMKKKTATLNSLTEATDVVDAEADEEVQTKNGSVLQDQAKDRQEDDEAML
jgi:hypothetical protein